MTKPKDKKWSEMDRVELIAERGRWESQLQEVNAALKAMGRLAFEGGKPPRAEHAALNTKRTKYAAAVRGIQAELSKIAEKRRLKPFSLYFLEEAEDHEGISDDLFDEIHDRAEARMNADNAAIKAAEEST